MNKPKVSVLIPVYNAEAYLKKCLDSVCTQTYEMLEIIIANDCSTDHSLAILNDYLENDNRITVINNKYNMGVQTTRNCLLDSSSGEYIIFVDADDFIENDEVEQAVKAMDADDCDLVVWRYNYIEDTGIRKCIINYSEYGIFSDVKITEYHLENLNTLYGGVLWNKCYRADIIKKHNIKFKSKIEDICFNADYMTFSNKVKLLNYYGYNYNTTNISITRKNKTDDSFKKIKSNWESYREVYSHLINTYNGKELTSKNKFILQYYLYKLKRDLIKRAKKIGALEDTKKLVNTEIMQENLRQHKQDLWKMKFKYKSDEIANSIRPIIKKIYLNFRKVKIYTLKKVKI